MVNLIDFVVLGIIIVLAIDGVVNFVDVIVLVAKDVVEGLVVDVVVDVVAVVGLVVEDVVENLVIIGVPLCGVALVVARRLTPESPKTLLT